MCLICQGRTCTCLREERKSSSPPQVDGPPPGGAQQVVIEAEMHQILSPDSGMATNEDREERKAENEEEDKEKTDDEDENDEDEDEEDDDGEILAVRSLPGDFGSSRPHFITMATLPKASTYHGLTNTDHYDSGILASSNPIHLSNFY